MGLTFIRRFSARRRDECSFKALRQDVTQKFFTIVTCNRLVVFCFFPKKKTNLKEKHMHCPIGQIGGNTFTPKKNRGARFQKKHHNCNFQSIFWISIFTTDEVEKSGDFVLKVDVYFCCLILLGVKVRVDPVEYMVGRIQVEYGETTRQEPSQLAANSRG